MTRIALPVWNGDISPVFDSARRLMIAEVDDGGLRSRSFAELPETTLAARAGRIAQLGVRLLICGAVSGRLAEMLAAYGVRVVAGTSGAADDVLAAYLRGGDFPAARHAMAGWRGGRRRRFRGGRGW